jgi:integrase
MKTPARPPLTEAAIIAAIMAGTNGKAYVMAWDGGASGVTGLGLRIRATGVNSWLYNYRPSGAGRSENSRAIALGRYPNVSLKDARTAARIHAGSIASGGDPAAARKAKRMQELLTVGSGLDRYEKSLERRRYVNKATAISTLRRNLDPLLNREAARVTLFDLRQIIDAQEEDGRAGAAEYFRKHATAFFKWLVSAGYTSENPMANYKRAASTKHEKSESAAREGRALDDNEIVALWTAAEQAGAFGSLVQLGLLTGFRRNELAGLRWDEISEDRIALPAERTKTYAAHAVALTPLMADILTKQRAVQIDGEPSPLVFPSERGATNGQMAGWSKLTPKLRKASGVQFSLHDLRRTCRTLAARCGVNEDIGELLIGHRRAALVQLYNKDDAWPQRKRAAELVSAHVQGLLTGEPVGAAVVNLAGRRAS